jgi:hypothetical protein
VVVCRDGRSTVPARAADAVQGHPEAGHRVRGRVAPGPWRCQCARSFKAAQFVPSPTHNPRQLPHPHAHRTQVV